MIDKESHCLNKSHMAFLRYEKSIYRDIKSINWFNLWNYIANKYRYIENINKQKQGATK